MLPKSLNFSPEIEYANTAISFDSQASPKNINNFRMSLEYAILKGIYTAIRNIIFKHLRCIEQTPIRDEFGSDAAYCPDI